MCCFVLVLAVLGPRVALAFTWLFTDRVSVAFGSNWWLPLAGLLLLPWTTLMYVLAYAPVFGVSTLGWLFVALGVALDVATWSSRAAQRRYEARNAV